MLTHEQEQALRGPRALTVRSPAFASGKAIPREHTGLGDDVSPELHLGGVPDGAKAIALVVDDPDAPRGTFTHWLVWNLPAEATTLPRGADVRGMGGVEGRNDFGVTGYRGPLPPSGTHRYYFRAFALGEPLSLPAGATPEQVWPQLAKRAIAWGELMGTFARR